MSAFEDILNEDDDVTETVATPEAEAGDAPTAVAETPASVEPETSDPAPVAEEAQPITREDGAIWSENAKRWYLNGKIVAGEAPTVEPSHPSAPQAPAPVVAEQPPAPVAPVGEPWTVRGGGQKHAIPGAFVTPEGKLVVEPEGQPRVRELIAAGIQHLQNYGREKQEWTQRIQQAEAAGQAKATLYNRVAADLFDKISDDNWLQALIDNPQREREFLRRELALSIEQAKMAIPARPQAQEPEVDIEAAFKGTLSESLDELFEGVQPGILSPEDMKELRERYLDGMAAYAAEHEGEVKLDWQKLQTHFARDLKIFQRANSAAIKAAEDAKKAKAAAAFNAANKPNSVQPPSKPKAKPVPVGTAPSAQKPAWDQAFKSAFSDDDDE